MYAFQYQRPTQLSDAQKAAQAGGQLLAGGQTMIAAMKQRLQQPETVVDLAAVSGLSGIQKSGQHIVIGAMTRHQDVANNAEVQKNIPGLAALANGIGDKQVRAMGTIGGSVANNDPAACYPSALLALGATIHTDRRTIAADDFFLGMYATALEAGEIITAVHFPIPSKSAYAKFKQPASRYSLVGVFVAQTAAGARVAITGASSGVFRHAGLEAALSQQFTPEAVANVTIDSQDLNADLHASKAYRAQLITVQTQRAVKQANG
ncbi:MAG: FAD binding domain-containing protein [Limnohabitans sp.]|jgi:carbon-monoxide dehydrogenase medium subunit